MNVLKPEKVSELSRLFLEGLSIRRAAAVLGISKITANSYYRQFRWLYSNPAALEEKEDGHPQV